MGTLAFPTEDLHEHSEQSLCCEEKKRGRTEERDWMEVFSVLHLENAGLSSAAVLSELGKLLGR